MANFEVNVVTIKEVQDHPNADRLVIYTFEENNYKVIAAKDNAQEVETKMLFIPEHSIVPEYLLKEFGFWDEGKDKGMLSGKEGNVVKPIKLRGVYSEGLALPVEKAEQLDVFKEYMEENKDIHAEDIYLDTEEYNYAAILGIAKYEVPIANVNPLTRETYVEPKTSKVRFDVDSYKKYSKYLVENEPVIATVKYHGSCAIYKVWRDPATQEIHSAFSTKSQANKGLWFKDEVSNWYSRANDKYAITYNLSRMLDNSPGVSEIVCIGEVYGGGVQKGWSYDVGEGDIGFKAFDLIIDKKVENQPVAFALLQTMNIPTVEVVYEGPFDIVELTDYANAGVEANQGFHEGIVVRPLIPRENPSTGDNLALKIISDRYQSYNSKRPIEEDIN